MPKRVNIFSSLFREMEADIGTRDMAIIVFEAVTKAIYSLKASTAKDFCRQFSELVEMISTTEPKFGILNYNFSNLLYEFKNSGCLKDFDSNKWKEAAVEKVRTIIERGRRHKQAILEAADQLEVDGKTILIHDHSHSVQDVLAYLKEKGHKFRVVIAEQDYEKTHGNIERLHEMEIEFQVVPSYMISHIHDQIDMAFFGAVTLKDTMHFVMSPGAYGMISEMYVDKIPVCMFIDTNKFSMWKSQKRGEIFIHKHRRWHHTKPIEYERIKYSHDRVPLKFFKKIVTNKGVFSPEEAEKFFHQKMAEVKQQEAEKKECSCTVDVD